MQQFIEYLDEQLPNEKGNELLFKFKRKTLDNMNERYTEVLTRGVVNEKVMIDLIKSEHADLKSEYNAYAQKKLAEKKAKNRAILNTAGSIIAVITIIVVYLAISFITKDWRHSWIIVVDGILLLVAYLLSFGVNRISKMRRVFHIIARVLMAIDTMVVSVAVFLFAVDVLHYSKSWVIVILGIMALFIADLVFATKTRQRLVIINYLIYIPVIATMLFIILGGLHIVSWSIGWLLIIAGLIVDLIVMKSAHERNKHIKAEVEDIWKEN